MLRPQTIGHGPQTGSVAIKIFLSSVFCLLSSLNGHAQDKEEPVIINGDIVEYSTDAKEATATGNVFVIYKGTKLSCQKLSINTQTKDAEADGNVRMEDATGVIEGTKIKYNFQTKTGIIFDSKFRANPYFGKSDSVKKVSDAEFIAMRGYMTTCSLDNPHYRIKSRKMDIFPDDKVKTTDNTFYLGKAPLLYIPQYNHSLKEPYVHVQMTPGKSKEWGPYMLSAWRYKLAEDLQGRIYFDYRSRLGPSEGFGLNYTTTQFGKGDYKYYYMQERPRTFGEGTPAEFQRYFIRWRHRWDIDEKTNLVSEYYKIVDSKMILIGSQYNILKDYFFREYEKDAQPLSYALLHHNFDYSSLDFTMQKRTNRWYNQTEKLPEIKYSLPSIQLGEDSPFYFQNSSSYINSNQKNSVPSPAENDITFNQFNSANKISLPMKVAFIEFTPSISGEDTYNDKSTYGATHQLVLSTGSDLSTKFYRIFDVRSNFLGLDINNLRHIITPNAGYSYNKTSTMPGSKARIGGGASTGSSSVALGLSNKLQTKRNDQSLDLVDFNVTSTYVIKPKSGDKRGSNLSDFLFELKLLPYSWMRVDADATYKHSGNRSDVGYKHFSNANYDITFQWTEERSFSVGQRYQFKGGNEITYSLNWGLSPKWKLSAYERYNRGHAPGLKRGLREQEYSLSRDLHCWIWKAVYNVRKGAGESIWFVFTLKAFPELEFEYNQSYHAPKPGSQSNP